jgi:hypothetical protein
MSSHFLVFRLGCFYVSRKHNLLCSFTHLPLFDDLLALLLGGDSNILKPHLGKNPFHLTGRNGAGHSPGGSGRVVADFLRDFSGTKDVRNENAPSRFQ